MVGQRMSRVARRYLKKIQKANTTHGLQEIASAIQLELDKRHLSYDEALILGNILQNQADQCPGNELVYAISDRDSYRRTLELYLRDALLTKTEQMLLWEERRRLGISQAVHDRLLEQLLILWKRQGRKVTIESFQDPNQQGGSASA